MGKEFELKFSASAESLDKISAAFDGGAVISMNTTYFDTPAGALSARKWTLRLRKENGESIITLKTAGDGVTRGEWEYAAETLADAAARLVALGAPEELEALLQEGVEPVCGGSLPAAPSPWSIAARCWSLPWTAADSSAGKNPSPSARWRWN